MEIHGWLLHFSFHHLHFRVKSPVKTYIWPVKKISAHFFTSLVILITVTVASAQPFPEHEKKEMCDSIRNACQHAWDGYKKYAWGYDALKPISNTPHNWYQHSLLMTPVDAFDTFTFLGMKDAASEAKELILSRLDFNADQSVQVFETTIRLLAALQTAYELDGDQRFLLYAKDLGNRLMPAFNSPTGMPYRFVNLKTGKTKDSISNPAEIGTLVLEFGKLSQLTGNPRYYEVAKKASLEIFKRCSKIGLPGSTIDVNTGEWKDPESHISGGIDSYYEYLYKAWLLFGDQDFKKAWEMSNRAVIRQLLVKENGGWYFTHADMNTGKKTFPYYGALDAFYAGLLALSGDTSTAAKIQQGNFHLWTQFNMEPEAFDFRRDTLVYNGYYLRPENLESCFYLYQFTKDDQYLRMGKRMIDDVLKNCKTPSGYAAIEDVKTMKQGDYMESFFFAETLKYSYLLFAPEGTIDLSKIVFNTEAHPLLIKK